MTVKEAVSVIAEAKELFICWDGELTKFDSENELMMDAFGHYKVKRIRRGAGDDTYEIQIAALPEKEVVA